MVMIFSHCEPISRRNLALSCKQFASIANEDDLLGVEQYELSQIQQPQQLVQPLKYYLLGMRTVQYVVPRDYGLEAACAEK